MNRREFLKVTGLVAVAPLAEPLTRLVGAERLDVTPLRAHEAGLYRLSGVVHLDAPVVEITGIANQQRMTWADRDASGPRTASFVSYEWFDKPGMRPNINVRGGHIEALSLVPVE